MCTKRISVIVPIYNALSEVKQLLTSLLKNFNFKLGEIYLINDCSNIETTSYLKDFVGNNKVFMLINNEETLGFVKTCNKGMKLAKSEFICLLNSDTKIPQQFCEKIIKCFESDEKIGIASPIGSFTAAYFIPLPKNYSFEKMNLLLDNKHKTVYPKIVAAEGFCFCIRKQVIEQQGYLDEIYGKGYGEEVDYAYRSLKNGWDNALIDNLYVYHKRQASFGSIRREKLLAKNEIILRGRYGQFIKEYREKFKLKNPVKKIYWEILPLEALKKLVAKNYRKMKYLIKIMI